MSWREGRGSPDARVRMRSRSADRSAVRKRSRSRSSSRSKRGSHRARRSESRDRDHRHRKRSRSRSSSPSRSRHRRLVRGSTPDRSDGDDSDRGRRKKVKKEKNKKAKKEAKTVRSPDPTEPDTAQIIEQEVNRQQPSNHTPSDDAKSFFAMLKQQEAAKEQVGTLHASGVPSQSVIETSGKWECSKTGCGHQNSKYAATCSSCGAMKRMSEWR